MKNSTANGSDGRNSRKKPNIHSKIDTFSQLLTILVSDFLLLSVRKFVVWLSAAVFFVDEIRTQFQCGLNQLFAAVGATQF